MISTSPLWTDIAGFWVNSLVAVGTVGAVVVSLVLASRATRHERESMTRAHALQLLEVLAEVHGMLPRFGGLMTRAEKHEREQVISRAAHVHLAFVPLMTPAIQQLSVQLRVLLGIASELAIVGWGAWRRLDGAEDWAGAAGCR